MRPPYRSRRTRAKHRYDQAQVDRDTGEVLEPVELAADSDDWLDDQDGDWWGRSVDGVLYGERLGDDVGEWPVRDDGLVMYMPGTWKLRIVK
jgi:hypothetical protein